MELVRANEQNKAKQVVAEAFLQISRLSLGAAIVLAPFRYRWLLQAHSIPPIFVEYTNQYLYPADIFLLLTLCFWLFSLLVIPKVISIKPRWLTVALGALVVISTASSFYSIDERLSIYNSVRMIMLFGLYLYLINEIHSFRFVAIAAGIQLFVQATIGIAQVLRQHSLNLIQLKELTLDPSAKGISIVWTNGLRSLRAYGLTDHPNILGGCLAFSLILLLVLYLEARPSWRPWITVLCYLGTLALLFTFSRAAWLGLFAGLAWIALWLAMMRNRKQILEIVTFAALIGLLLIPFLWGYSPLLSSRLNLDGSFNQATPENQAINERALLFTQAIQLITKHPLSGAGVGTFPEALQRQDPQYPFDYQPPHLVPLQIAAEIGLPGAGLYLFILVSPWIALFINRDKLKPSLHLAGISAALLAIGVVSFLDYYPWLLNPGRIWQWLIWGIWASFYQLSLTWNNHD
jgi:hypothetical protein